MNHNTPHESPDAPTLSPPQMADRTAGALCKLILSLIRAVDKGLAEAFPKTVGTITLDQWDVEEIEHGGLDPLAVWCDRMDDDRRGMIAAVLSLIADAVSPTGDIARGEQDRARHGTGDPSGAAVPMPPTLPEVAALLGALLAGQFGAEVDAQPNTDHGSNH